MIRWIRRSEDYDATELIGELERYAKPEAALLSTEGHLGGMLLVEMSRWLRDEAENWELVEARLQFQEDLAEIYECARRRAALCEAAHEWLGEEQVSTIKVERREA